MKPEKDEFIEDSHEAGLMIGTKINKTVKPLVDGMKSFVGDWWSDQKELKDIEKKAYRKELKKVAKQKGKQKAREKLNKSNKPIRINLMEEDWNGKFN